MAKIEKKNGTLQNKVQFQYTHYLQKALFSFKTKYSHVCISSDEVFFKILKKPYIVQK